AHCEKQDKLLRTGLQRTREPYFINVVDDLEGLSEVDQIKRLIDQYYAFVSENLYSVKFVVSLLLRDEKHPDDLIGHVNELHRVYRNLLADILDSGRQKGVFRAKTDPRMPAPARPGRRAGARRWVRVLSRHSPQLRAPGACVHRGCAGDRAFRAADGAEPRAPAARLAPDLHQPRAGGEARILPAVPARRRVLPPRAVGLLRRHLRLRHGA